MTITISLSPRFQWCVEVYNGDEWILYLRIPSREIAEKLVAEKYPGITPTLDVNVQTSLFDELDKTQSARGKTRGKSRQRRAKEAK